MGKPCAVFWDIENIDVPKGQSIDSIVDQIRVTIIKACNLDEIFFFCVCVCDVHKLPESVGQSLPNLHVDIVQAYNGAKDSVDDKIMDLMRKFVKVAGQDCTIILLSGDADYYGTLSELKKLHNVSIYLIKLADSCSPKLDEISDLTYILNNGVLMPVESTGAPMYFISIKRYPEYIRIIYVMADLNNCIRGISPNSAILFDHCIYLGTPTLWSAERAMKQLKVKDPSCIVELVQHSPLTEILKCIKSNVDRKTKSNEEVKQLTFIKMNNSNGADISKIIKFCIACDAQLGVQCILKRKPFLWIGFSYESDAQDCLSKVKILYPDAIISDPSISDLTLAWVKNPYIVESCEQKATEATSRVDNATKPKPEKDMQASLQNQSSSDDFYANIGACIEPKAIDESVDLKTTMDSEPRLSNTSVFDYNSPNLFLLCDKSNSIFNDPDDKPTKWSLLYNLFEQLYDLGAKKVIFDGNLYCAHFDSVSACQDALGKMHLRYLEPFKFQNAQNLDKRFTDKLNQYMPRTPWCLHKALNIYCLVVKVDDQIHTEFKEMCANILGNRACIFLKLFLGQFWIGFPNKLLCRYSKETVLGFLGGLKQIRAIAMAEPSDELLKSIGFQDLVGDAYDLAFLSRQLAPDLITRLNIREQKRFIQTETQECNETLVHITVNGNFRKGFGWFRLSLEQIVKILIYFSKVIPLAVTASYDEVNLVFNSRYEAHTASHFINKLTIDEVPYFEKFNGASKVQQEQLVFANICQYYVINDKRRVREKIMRNEILVDRIHCYSSKVESTPDIDVLDGEAAKKLKYLFTITTDSDFKFTSGMISIIKMHLVSLDCPVCIEFEDKIWVGVDDLEKEKKAKARIEQIKFKMLHEKDEEDFEVGVTMQLVSSSPTEVAKMLAIKLMKPTEPSSSNVYSIPSAEPLGHFNYNYRKAVGMTITKFVGCKSEFLV